MEDEEKQKEFIKKLNIDRAKKLSIFPIILMTLSLLTYIVPLVIR